MTETTANPYVGPRTFSKDDRNRFFGREQEARDLVSLVISERLVLFYAQSGAGKSSLINTRLIPKLVEEEGFVALPVGRVSGELPQGITEVENMFVFNLILSLEQSQRAPERFTHMSLTDFLSKLSTSDGETYFYQEPDTEDLGFDESYQEPPHVLIIDQFEEIITSHLDRWQDRAGFFAELNQALLDDPLLWVVLTLREDYVAALRPYHRTLYNNMRARYYMKRMESGAALQAVENPAALAGRPFAPGVAQTLVDNLRQIRVQGQDKTQAGQFVEPVQLQVVCYQLWENLKDAQKREITGQDLEEMGDVDTALSQYYEQAVAVTLEQTDTSEVELRNWFDRRLITEAATRGTVYRGETETAGMANNVVDVLASQFLLRPEIRAGGAWYELVHDRFVSPILLANQAWRARQSPLLRAAEAWGRSNRSRSKLLQGEELKGILATVDRGQQEPLVQEFLAACEDAQSQRDLAAAQAEAEEQARAARRLRLLSIGLAIAIFLAVGFAYLTAQQTVAANAAASEANAARATSDANAQLAATSAAEADENAQLAATRAAEANESAQLAATSESDAIVARATAEANEELAVMREAEANVARATSEANAQLAQENAAAAETVSRISLAQSLAAQAPRIVDRANDTELATLLAVEALRISREEGNEDVELVDSALRDVLSEPDYNTVLQGHDAPVLYTTFDPNGRFLASADTNGTILFWELAGSSTPIASLTLSDEPSGISFSPDGQILAVALFSSDIDLWDTSDLEAGTADALAPLLTLSTGGSPLTNLLIPEESDFLLGYGEDGNVLRWDLSREEPEANIIFSSPDSDLRHLAISSDGRLLASYLRGTVFVRDLNSPSRAILRTFTSGRDTTVTHAAFGPNDRYLTTAESDGSIAIWDVESAVVRVNRFRIQQDTRIDGLAFNQDGNIIATISAEDLSLRLWHRDRLNDAPMKLVGHNSEINHITFSRDALLLASASEDRTIRLWQWGGTDIAPEILDDHLDAVQQVAYDEDGQLLYTLTETEEDFQIRRILYLWDLSLSPPEVLATIEAPTIELPPTLGAAPRGRYPIALHAGTRRLAMANLSEEVEIWSFNTEEETMTRAITLTGNIPPVSALAFSNDGQLLAVATSAESVLLWNLAQGTSAELTGHTSDIGKLVFGSDDTLLAAVDQDLYLTVWDLQGAPDEPLIIDTGHDDQIDALSFNRDGTAVATGSRDLEVRVWQLSNGANATPLVLKGHADWVLSVVFSPDGSVLASASWDRTVRLWELSADDPENATTILKGHEGPINQIQFSSSGDKLASVSQDRTARIWIVAIDKFVEIACSEVRRNLALGEWERYLGDEPYQLTCPNHPVHSSFFAEAERLARTGDIQGARALLATVVAIDPNLDFDPATRVNQYAALGIIETGNMLAATGDLEGAEAAYAEALALDPTLDLDPVVQSQEVLALQLIDEGIVHAIEGDIDAALDSFADAEEVAPDLEIDAIAWNDLCWFGSLWNRAEDVLEACETAVALAPNDGDIRDSRGVARALIGDFAGAIADFEFFVEWLEDNGFYTDGGEGREAWIEALQNGQNPFDEETLLELRRQS